MSLRNFSPRVSHTHQTYREREQSERPPVNVKNTLQIHIDILTLQSKLVLFVYRRGAHLYDQCNVLTFIPIQMNKRTNERIN